MELIKGFEIVDLSLYCKEKELLIISDIHIGYEEELNKRGFLVPRVQFKDIIERVGAILVKTEPKTIIINGDLKHEFGTISEQEWRDTLRFLDFLKKTASKIILIKGNHDTILGPIAKKRENDEVEIVDDYSFTLKNKTKVFICHGNEISKSSKLKLSNLVIIGHEHPAISISDGIRREKYKCFLKGKFKQGLKDKEIIVLPSFNIIVEGTDVKNENLLSPFLKKPNADILEFEVHIPTHETVMNFGKLKNIE